MTDPDDSDGLKVGYVAIIACANELTKDWTNCASVCVDSGIVVTPTLRKT